MLLDEKEYKIDKTKKEMLENLPLPMGVYYGRNGKSKLLVVSDGMCKLLRRSREEIMNEAMGVYACFIHPDDYKLRIESDIESDILREKTTNHIYRLLMPDNTYIWVTCTTSTEKIDDSSRLYYRVFADITNVRESQLTTRGSFLQRSARLKEAFDTLNVPIFWKSKERRFLGANQAFLDFVGLDDISELTGKRGEDFPWLEERELFYKDELKVFRTGVATYRMYGHMLVNSIRHDVIVDKNPIYENGKVVAFVGRIENVTAEYEAKRRFESIKNVISNVPVGMCFFSSMGDKFTCMGVNQALENNTLIKGKELEGKDLWELGKYFHPEDIERIREHYVDLLKDKEKTSLPCRIMTANGYVWFRLSANSVKFEKQRLIIITLVDISEERKKVILYEEKLKLLHKSTSSDIIASAHFDVTNNILLDYARHSETAPYMDGVTTYDEMINTAFRGTVTEREKRRIKAKIKRGILLERFNNGEHEFFVEYNHNLLGHITALLQLKFNLIKSDNGNIECFFYVYNQTKHYIEKEIIKNFAELGYEVIAMVDVFSRKMVFYSTEMKEMFDQSTHADYDKYLKEKIIPFVPDTHQLEVEQTLSLENVVKELSFRRVYSYSHPFSLIEASPRRRRVQMLYLSEEEEGKILIVGSDITEQYMHDISQMHRLHEAIMRAEKAIEERSMFLSSVSHDMRTPLNGIIGYTNFALKEKDEIRRHDYLEKIKLSSSLLLNLVNDTLELSRIESGKVELKKESIKADELLDAITVGVKMNAAAKGVVFETYYDSKLPKVLKIDILRVQETCLNLLTNAIKFSSPGKAVYFEVYHLEDRDDGYNTKIVVKDEGIGISEKFMPYIFEPFSQGNAGVGNSIGAGLGLAIVRRYVDLLGGRIEVESSLGVGTTFSLYFTFDEDEDKKSVLNEETMINSLNNRHILLVEDNFLNTEIATILLTEKGARVTHAEDGIAALEIFSNSKENEFDAILMDLRMPRMNGYEATEKIRSLLRKDACTVPIIAMSADAYDDDISHCISVGMNKHISKPVDPTSLFKVLAEAFYD